jgi:hypothetical protein
MKSQPTQRIRIAHHPIDVELRQLTLFNIHMSCLQACFQACLRPPERSTHPGSPRCPIFGGNVGEVEVPDETIAMGAAEFKVPATRLLAIGDDPPQVLAKWPNPVRRPKPVPVRRGRGVEYTARRLAPRLVLFVFRSFSWLGCFLESVISAHSSAGHSCCLPAFRSVLPKQPCSLTALRAGC